MNTEKTAKEAEKAGTEAEALARKAAEKAEARAESLKAELTDLRRDFESLVAQVGKVGKAGVEDARRTAEAKYAEGKQAGEHLLAEVSDEWNELDRRVVSATRDNPWRSLGYAALAGLVVGMILRR